MLDLSSNNFIGNIPATIFNISTIIAINLNANSLSGSFPLNLPFALPNLKGLYVAQNYLDGKISDSLANATMLTELELADNSFSSYIPHTLGNLRNLEFLHLSYNNLTDESFTPELSIFSSLENCRFLRRLDLSHNPLSSILPISIGNLSDSLEYFHVSKCDIGGNIPTSIGNLSGLISLELDENQLTGIIPTQIGNMRELQALVLHGNKLQGSFPPELCHLKNIVNLYLGKNGLSGSIPTCLGNLTSLRELRIDSNAINSRIPSSLWGLLDLLVLDLSMNKLNGSLSLEIGNINVLRVLNLLGNHLSGRIPNTIAQLQDLTNLSLAQNEFEGPIPKSLSNMISLELLDLSKNNLSGVIPMSLMALVYLYSFNVSFNKLEGEIPNGGPFMNFSSQSFMGNVALCGGPPHLQFPKCNTWVSSKSSKTTITMLKFVLPIAIVTILILIYVLMKCQKKRKPLVSEVDTTVATWTRISFLELQRATNGFSEANLLGSGSFGKVYNGILSNGINIAVKVFNLELEVAFKSFDTECEILCNVRHRNLVKIVSNCANLDFKALVLSYMPNGSLEKWLHSHDHYLNIIQRLNIMIDVATALNYLHHECSIPIVHCDLKPSNVLLDEDMVGHLSDFGIGKLLNGGDSITQTMTLATIGYMAPEYGLEGIVSRRGDVYSYGILLMETFTQKKPTNEMFYEGFNLRHWVQESYHRELVDIIDVKLLAEDGVSFPKKRNCLSSVIGLALDCSTEFPNERKDINEVLVALQKIKRNFLNQVIVPRSSI